MSVYPNSFIGILRCPITHQALAPAGEDELERLNSLISEGVLLHISGVPVRRLLDSAVLSQDGRIAYIIEDGIIVLLHHLAIVCKETEETRAAAQEMGLRGEKQAVLNYYEELGWEKTDSGKFEDTIRATDQRIVTQEYYHKCHMRLAKYLPERGRYILDVASGPIPHSEYLSYSDGFEKRVCVDLSIHALREARHKLGEKGIYIQGDITNLPFKMECMDAVISLHTIYHVPEDEQRQAFDEIHRVLSPSGIGLIVYTFGEHASIAKIFLTLSERKRACTQWLDRHILWRFRRSRPHTTTKTAENVGSKGSAEVPSLYFHPHDYRWFTEQVWKYPVKIITWRSLGQELLKMLVHDSLFGKQLLKLLYSVENLFPRLMGKIGEYPLIIINKGDS